MNMHLKRSKSDYQPYRLQWGYNDIMDIKFQCLFKNNSTFTYQKHKFANEHSKTEWQPSYTGRTSNMDEFPAAQNSKRQVKQTLENIKTT